MKITRIIYTVETEAVVFEDDENFEDNVRFDVTYEDVMTENVREAVHEGNFVIVSTRITEEEDNDEDTIERA